MCQDIEIDDTGLFSSVEEFKKYCIGVPFKGVWYFYQVCEN
jgi:hypothetical protein